MKDVEFVKLEDNKLCIILDEFVLNNIKYVILVNAQDEKDYIVRKEIEDKLVGLANGEEFDNVMTYYLRSKGA
jgi:hypothetical protein